MKAWEQVTHYAGFDWAKDHHDVVVLDKAGRIQADFRIEHSAAGWQQWRERIRAFPELAVAIETSQGTAIEQYCWRAASRCILSMPSARSATGIVTCPAVPRPITWMPGASATHCG